VRDIAPAGSRKTVAGGTRLLGKPLWMGHEMES